MKNKAQSQPKKKITPKKVSKPALPKRLEIKWVPITSIKPATYNPRDISEAAFMGLMESIKKWGIVDPFVVNIRTGELVLVGGHQRLKAAEALGHTEVPVVKVDLSLAEEKALNVTLNNQKIAGHYTEGLESLIEEIRSEMGEDFMKSLKLDEMVLPDGWADGMDAAIDTEANLDGITTVIKIFCPQNQKEFLVNFLKEKFEEMNIEGVGIV